MRRHIYLLASPVVDPLGPPLVDLDFPDEHPAVWINQAQADGVVCIAAGPSGIAAYPNVWKLLEACHLGLARLAVRASETGVFTGPG